MTETAGQEELQDDQVQEIRMVFWEGRMLRCAESKPILEFHLKNSVLELVEKLDNRKDNCRDKTGRIVPGSIAASIKMLGTVEAGFPSPAEEELIDTLSLDDFLIRNREATFFLKVSGDSMKDAGIMPGDIVIIDRSLTPKNGQIVIAQVDGNWTMKYLQKRGNTVSLVPANRKYPPIKPQSELKIAGVVTGVIRKYI